MKSPTTPRHLRRTSPSAVASTAAIALLLVLLSGCGHPATKQECDEIFRRTVEIELRAQNVPAADIQDKVDEAYAARGSELQQRCVGNRVTNAAMSCVRDATTASELEGCLEWPNFM